ncbi:hypothetical protein D3C77_302460 [compost metagenome]
MQLIGEIGTQVSDIVRTEGQLKADKAAREELALQGNQNPTPTEVQAARAYQEVMEKYGTGGDYQRAAQAVTAALQGLVGGDIGSALAGASAPYLANIIKQTTEGNDTARIMAQAVLGAVVAQAQGNSASSGAAGAATGELIAARLYPNIKREDLSEAQRQTISALSTLAAGFVGGAAGGDLGGALAGAQSGRNAVENNELGSRVLADKLYRAYAAQSCSGLSADVCRSNYGKKIGDESHLGTVAAVGGVVAGGVLFGPELLAACGVNLAACTELGIAAAEMPFGAATTGGAALGMGGFGSIAAKEVAATADAAAAVRNGEGAKEAGFKVGLSVDDITAINSQFGGSVSFREVDTAIANAANYDGFYNKAGSMIRDIAGGHLFDNGNKRTAVEVVEQLIIKNGVDGPPKQVIWNVVDKVATGELTSVQDISKALRGLD